MLSSTNNTGVEHLLNNIVNYLNDNEEGASLQSQCTGTAKHCIRYFSKVHNGFLEIANPSKLLEVTSLQAAIDACLMSQATLKKIRRPTPLVSLSARCQKQIFSER